MRARFAEEVEWRFACGGDLDGRVFFPRVEEEEPLRLGPLRLDLCARRAEVEGAEMDLTRREFDLLAALASEPGRVFTEEELVRDIWGGPGRSAVRTLDSHAWKVRRKLEEAGARGFVVNYRRVGYRLAAGGAAIGADGGAGA